jgi:trigger factor
MGGQVEQLGDNRVRLTVDVSPHELEHAVEHATSDLAESIKIPGFRKGKVPMPGHPIGKERIWVEAVESHISGWFWSTAARTRLRPVAAPEFDFELPTSEGEQWSFTAIVEVQPTPEIVDWTQLEVLPRRGGDPAGAVDQSSRRCASPWSAGAAGDRGAQQETRSSSISSACPGVPVGHRRRAWSGRLSRRSSRRSRAKTGETRDVSYQLADGSTETVSVSVKHVNEKVLPEIDDELARSASEFDSLADLRADIEGRIGVALEEEIDAAFRAAAVDRLVAESKVEGAGPLVESRARELLDGFIRSLGRRGIAPETYFQVTGQSPELLVAQMRAEAAQSVARELALEAVAEKAGIEVSDDEVKELIREQAQASGDDPDEVIADIWAHGHQETLREDLRLKAALDRLAADVKPISAELADAREKLWTPDKENTETEKKLWTPGTKEPE